MIFSLKLLCGEQYCAMAEPSSSSSLDFTLGGPELSCDPCNTAIVTTIMLYSQQYSKILAVTTETWSDHWTFFTFFPQKIVF